MMVHEQTRFLLCTLHKDKPWQVQLNVFVQKETVVTLSCNGGSYVHLTGHYRIDSEKAPFNPNWITTLSWHILDEKINELKNKGTCLKELTEYLNKYTTIKIEEKWIVSPYSIKKKQIQENRISLQVLNLKRKNFMKDNNRTEETKRVRSLLHCNENINFNNVPSENLSEIPSEESSESSSENFSDISFQDSSMESNDNDEENKENKSSIYHLRSKNKQKNESKNENKNDMQKRRKEESEKQEIKDKQQKAKITEEKSKEKDPDKTKKNSKQQNVRIIKGGMKVQELRPGTGKIAEVGKYVTIYYVAYVKTGLMLEEFDRFEKLGFRFKLGAGFVIKGLDVGVFGMKIDEKRRLVIPPNMAYV